MSKELDISELKSIIRKAYMFHINMPRPVPETSEEQYYLQELYSMVADLKRGCDEGSK